jgi:hypothetical protein
MNLNPDLLNLTALTPIRPIYSRDFKPRARALGIMCSFDAVCMGAGEVGGIGGGAVAGSQRQSVSSGVDVPSAATDYPHRYRRPSGG